MARQKKGTPGHEAACGKHRRTLIEKLGSEEAVREYYRRIGAIGGRNGHTGGFAANKKLAVEAGAKGGHKSLRGYEVISDEDGEVTYKNKKTGETIVKHL